MIEVLLGDVDAEMPIHRRQNILRFHGTLLWFSALGIRFPDDPPTLDSST